MWLEHYPIAMREAALAHWASILADCRASEAEAAARAARNRRVERLKFRRFWRRYPVEITDVRDREAPLAEEIGDFG